MLLRGSICNANDKEKRKPCCCRKTARCRCNFPRWRPAAILDLIEPEIAPFDPPTNLERNMKWIWWPVAEIWPFEIWHITRAAFGTPFLREGEVQRVIDRTTGNCIGSFLYAPHYDHCAMSNYSVAICHRMSATLNSTGGQFGSKF